MKIKLIMKKPLSYFFHGPVTLSNLNNIDNPFEIELDSLSKQDIIGINRAHSTEVISIVEGLEEFKAKLATLSKTKKETILEPIETTNEKEKEIEVIEPVVETIVEPVKEDKTEVVDEQPVKEDEPVKSVEEIVKEDKVEQVETKEEAPKATTRRRTTTKK